MSSVVLSTTVAVEKCKDVPLVKNRGPTVGTPLNILGGGVPGGGPAAGPAVIPLRFRAGVAAAIRAGVQNASAVRCAPVPTAYMTPLSGFEPPVDAPAIPPTVEPAATAAIINATARRRCRRA